MPLPAKNKTVICEQCGAPLLSLPGEEGCLNCLLTTGIEGDTNDAPLSPNEPRGLLYQHYEILTRPDGAIWELGRGAMGVTYKARHVSLETTVALKVINARFSSRPALRQRFLREAQAAAQLRHPNVASVFHFGTIEQASAAGAPEKTGGGDCFYAMEFVEGESLEARLRRVGPLPTEMALEIALQVARALVAAEKRSLVHRDLKPSNIMLVADEEGDRALRTRGQPGAAWVKVIDFGLAKLAGNEDSSPAEQRFLGTPAFASPEQTQARTIDGRSDIYSLGVTLWCSLTGELYRRGKTFSPAPLLERRIPQPVVRLLKSMLAPAPQDRPGSALELAEALEGHLNSVVEAKRSSKRGIRRWAMAAGLAIAAGLSALAIYFTAPVASHTDKSIAVLPFRNLSDDPKNAFFAEGVQDDILSRLVKIRDLKVIGRRGTPAATANARNDLRAIGRELGVAHLLEGSLRRSGDRVLLHVSLIEARDGREIWSESYDRRLVDAMNLQGELASDIAAALKAQLSPQEQVDVRASATHNPDSYMLYLQGRKLENSSTFQIANYEAAQALYSQAVVLDPRFALAHVRLASVLGLLYRFRGPSSELRQRAYAEVGEALRLQPDLGEAHLAQGFCDYRIARDFDRALPEFEIAHRLLPNDTEPEFLIALIHRRQGRWREARAGLERVRAREPLNRRCEEELHATACVLRDWPAAAQHGDRAASIPPIFAPLKVERALVHVWQNGNVRPLQEALAAIASFPDAEGNLTWERWDAAMLARDFTAAEAALDAFRFDTLPSVLAAPIPKSYLDGCIHLAQGDREHAQTLFEAARPSMEAEVLGLPDDAMRHARLGVLYAYMGRKADALREGERATQLMPVSADALDGHEWLCHLALIHAWVGDNNEAISMVESLLRQPGCVSPLNEAVLTLSDLRLRWQWDPLRRNPRFQKILAGPEPATVF